QYSRKKKMLAPTYQILSVYCQAGREVWMGGIQEVDSGKGTLDSHERILANSYHKRAPRTPVMST
ncbi:MAG: hypothetical protein WBZ36_13585, partial [Candidatus Nitrosopolaris sp.]